VTRKNHAKLPRLSGEFANFDRCPQDRNKNRWWKSMLRAKENEEFDKWWQHWIATVAQSCMVAAPPASGNKLGDNVVSELGDYKVNTV
jgi:hypothetical protein